jgi:CRP/FNR family transcriptional regulator, nitrogen fixation regulation protein
MHALVHSATIHSLPTLPVLAQPHTAHAHQVTMYAPDAEIYAQGEKSGALYQVEFGAVRVYRLLADGRRQVVAFHFAGETFGFEAQYLHSFFAEAVVQTGVRPIAKSANCNVSPELMALALRGMVRAQEHLLVVGRQSATEKLAAFLMDIAERQGDLDQIDLPMSRTDIGDYLGLTIETVSRSLTKLRAAGIIRVCNTRSIEILKPAKLRLMCQ